MFQTILIVEDDQALADALKDILELAGYRTALARDGKEALALLKRGGYDLMLSDVHMPEMDGHQLLRHVSERYPTLPVLLMTAYGSIERAVEAMRDGAADYLVKPFEAEQLVAAVARYVSSVDRGCGEEPVAVDVRSRDLLSLAARVAVSEATVMVAGESGTGKEVVARYIHRHSKRGDGPFVAINCAAIPENMLEATLFGYEKGAFTGAYKATPGKFEQAQGGTLLLDEISEMDLALQAKLLRVLQEREVERLGSNRLIRLDVRVLATSNRDMRAEVAAGRFREDLYYRLHVFPITLPSLRERPADIVPLAEHLLSQAAVRSECRTPRLSRAAKAILAEYRWPGNVRELDNLMQRALILCQGDEVSGDDIHFESVVPTAEMAPPMATPRRDDLPPPQVEGQGLSEELKANEYQLIMDALKLGSRKAAAESLGISPRTLRHKLQRLREAGYAVA